MCACEREGGEEGERMCVHVRGREEKRVGELCERIM